MCRTHTHTHGHTHTRTHTRTHTHTHAHSEDRGSLSTLIDTIKTNYNARADEIRKKWGGGIMGSKALAAKAKLDKLKAKELASKM